MLNLEEPALFNEVVERFVALVEANRRARAIRGRYWLALIARSVSDEAVDSFFGKMDCFTEPVIGARVGSMKSLTIRLGNLAGSFFGGAQELS